jgi:hypothetical protein
MHPGYSFADLRLAYAERELLRWVVTRASLDGRELSECDVELDDDFQPILPGDPRHKLSPGL